MIKNNNKAKIRKLAIHSVKSDRMRNVFLLITIVLSVALFAGLALGTSGIEVKDQKALAKSQHAIYQNITMEQAKGLSAVESISDLLLYKQGKSMEVENYILIPYYYDQTPTAIDNVKLVEGHYPESKYEVAVDKQLLERMGKSPELGQELKFTFLDGATETFTLSGYMDQGNPTDIYSLCLSEIYASEGSQLRDISWNAAIRIEGASKMSRDTFMETIIDIGDTLGILRQNINENNRFTATIETDWNNIGMTIGIGMIILLISILVIYSIFYISISERTRQYGQFRTLGMTKKQVKQMIRIEGFLLWAIGAPIGILLGAFFAYVVLPGEFSYRYFMGYSIVILFFDYIAIMLALLKPAKKAAEVSPMEATKYSGYGASVRAKKSRKMNRRLTPYGLASIAARRNYKKSAMTMVSLGIAGILFITGTTLLQSINKEEYSRQGWLKFGEFEIYLSSNAAQTNEYGYTGIKEENPLNQEFIEQIGSIHGVDEVLIAQQLDIEYEYKNVNSNDAVVPFSKNHMNLINSTIKTGYVDYDHMVENKEILICHNDIMKEIFGFKFKVGDQVILRWYNGREYVEDEFTIAGEVKESIYKSEEGYKLALNAGWFLLPQELLEEMMVSNFNLNNTITVVTKDDSNMEEIEEELSRMVDANPLLRMDTLRESIIEDEYTYQSIYITILGFALFIIGFSIINLINTLITNVMSRKQEYAMLQSIGMSNRQLNSMIQGEGFYLAFYNILITITLGSACGYGLIAVLRANGVEYMHFHYPFWYLLGYIVLIFASTMLISRIAIGLFQKKSLVERIREGA